MRESSENEKLLEDQPSTSASPTVPPRISSGNTRNLPPPVVNETKLIDSNRYVYSFRFIHSVFGYEISMHPIVSDGKTLILFVNLIKPIEEVGEVINERK